jgi:hypothetical protein
MHRSIIFLAIFLSPVSLFADWSLNKAIDEIPNIALQGMIFGEQFDLDSAEYNGMALVLNSEQRINGLAKTQLAIFIRDISDNDRVWNVSLNNEPFLPAIHVMYRKDGLNRIRNRVFSVDYQMRLEIEELTTTTISGKLHISLPDYQHSYIEGHFVASRTDG